MSALSTVLLTVLATQAGGVELGRAPALAVPGRTADVVTQGAMDLDINEKKSELTLSYAFSGRSQRTLDDAVTAETVQSSFTAEVTLPLGGGDNLLSREAFDGLSDGPSLSLTWTSFSDQSSDPLSREHNPRLGPVADRAVQACLAAVQAGTAPTYSVERCQRITYPLLRTFSGLNVAQLNRALLTPVAGYGIEASAGLNRFSYRTPITLAENSETLRQFSIKAFGILFPSDGVSMVTASARYESSYEAQDDQILCRPVVVNADDDCVSAPPGRPDHVEKLQLELEYRRVLGDMPGLGRFAIAPRVSFDAMNGEYEAELPVYLTPTGTNRILPGLSVSYDSRHDEVVVGLFLRRSFSF